MSVLAARTRSANETKALAAALATLVEARDVLLLEGEMGVGKTAFAQGFARGLGVTDHVTSPTFTLVRSHPGRLLLHHVDVYRLDRVEEVLDIGLAELVDGSAVTLIEWGDVVAPVLPGDYLEVQLGFGDDDDERSLALRPVGPRWVARQRSLAELLAPWAGGAEPC